MIPWIITWIYMVVSCFPWHSSGTPPRSPKLRSPPLLSKFCAPGYLLSSVIIRPPPILRPGWATSPQSRASSVPKISLKICQSRKREGQRWERLWGSRIHPSQRLLSNRTWSQRPQTKHLNGCYALLLCATKGGSLFTESWDQNYGNAHVSSWPGWAFSRGTIR